MNKKYTITYLPLFYKDMDKIIKYISKTLKNKVAADNLISEVKQKIEKRAYNPNSYEKYSSIKRKNIYYRLYVKNYIVFYIVKNDNIEVRRILYNKRNFDKLI